MVSEVIKTNVETIDKIFEALQLMILKQFTEKEETDDE